MTFGISVVCTDDHSRVVLSPIEGVAGSDFINATRVDVSYRFLFHRIASYIFITFHIVLVSLVTSCTCKLRGSRCISYSNLIPKISFHSVYFTCNKSNCIHFNVCDVSSYCISYFLSLSFLFPLFYCFFFLISRDTTNQTHTLPVKVCTCSFSTITPYRFSKTFFDKNIKAGIIKKIKICYM